jgi:hypothetical protein
VTAAGKTPEEAITDEAAAPEAEAKATPATEPAADATEDEDEEEGPRKRFVKKYS